MTDTPALDHIALLVPNLPEVVERLKSAFGLEIEMNAGRFALLADPATGLKLELGQSEDAAVHFRHLGFRTEDVDAAHETLVSQGMDVSEPPHRRDFARMRTSFLKEAGGLEVQLVKYD
jgi:hypothetical protein